MNKIISIFSLILITNILYSQNNWKLVSNNTKGYYRSISFADDNNAIVVGNGGVVIKTMDAGNTWKNVEKVNYQNNNSVCYNNNNYCIVGDLPLIVSYHKQQTKLDTTSLRQYVTQKGNKEKKHINFSSIQYLNNSNGFISGNSVFYEDNYSEGFILKTTDAGAIWNKQTFPYHLNKLKFIDTKNGFVVCENGIILKTTDGGNTWLEKKTGYDKSIRDVDFINTQIGYAVGGNGGAVILQTNDGGNTWNKLNINCDIYLIAVKFRDSQIGYATGAIGTILKTIDGGVTWANESQMDMGDINDIWYLKEKIVIVGETGVHVKEFTNSNTRRK